MSSQFLVFFKIKFLSKIGLLNLLDLLLIQMIYLKASLICVLIGLCSSVLMESIPSKVQPVLAESHGQNLGFGNQTGPATNTSHVSSFINFINSAGIFYRDDHIQRFTYISNKMRQTYGNDTSAFSVIQMGNETNWSWGIYPYNGIYGSVAPGADRVYPQNSYMFLNDVVNSDGRTFITFLGQKGYFIYSAVETVIRNTILFVEDTPTCECSDNPSNIGKYLNQYDGSKWNVFCSESSNFYAALYTRSGKYIYIKPKNCNYLLYENLE